MHYGYTYIKTARIIHAVRTDTISGFCGGASIYAALTYDLKHWEHFKKTAGTVLFIDGEENLLENYIDTICPNGCLFFADRKGGTCDTLFIAPLAKSRIKKFETEKYVCSVIISPWFLNRNSDNQVRTMQIICKGKP